eukprot:gnl/TRDRNA2_/TRDRNA2_173487_c3_seq24.p2 gnl/TRDRNA2_/TRDRNA2_173487_c3~~gnl/TRDRNA2_/TRDRNA2_173487_c3_seq24.p2  ORF type:complete len:111 (-),score=14.84 gnl/TRDRNA2_/TRDRNA2_173487_c3_seq24:693-1025(-)
MFGLMPQHREQLVILQAQCRKCPCDAGKRLQLEMYQDCVTFAPHFRQLTKRFATAASAAPYATFASAHALISPVRAARSVPHYSCQCSCAPIEPTSLAWSLPRQLATRGS